MNSLKARLLLAATFILMAFVALTGVALEHGFQRRAEEAEQDKLQGLIYALIGATDSDRKGALVVQEAELRNSRLGQPDSGLYALIFNAKGETVWQSHSVLDPVAVGVIPPVNSWRYFRTTNDAGSVLFAESFTVHWAGRGDPLRSYTFLAAEDTTEFSSQMRSFRRELWVWLLVPAVLLLLTQAAVLRWGLAPLGRLVSELRGIESGSKADIGGRYPDELQPLTKALNALLRNERNQQSRYRHALDDLAHSLKTPLAVLIGESERSGLPDGVQSRLQEQLGRIRQIVDYQLKKAAAAGSRSFTAPVAIRPLVDKLAAALGKVYRDKAVRYDINIAGNARLRIDEGDLMEMLGNLLDNASKWCRRESDCRAGRRRYETAGRG
jgi:two-component system sensor histidine kinase PhoQ